MMKSGRQQTLPTSLQLALLVPFLAIPILCGASASSLDQPAATGGDHQQMRMVVDQMPREDVALLYQRLKAGDNRAAIGGGGGRAGQQQTSSRNRTTTKTAAAKTQPPHPGRRKIAPPVVIAVFSSSATAPTSRPPSTARLSSSTSTSKLRSIANTTKMPLTSSSSLSSSYFSSSSSQSASSSDGQSAASASPVALWPPSFFQVSRVTAIIFFGVFFSLATTIGNALVMLSICVDRKLQTISNYFLFSLAVADLTIGLISIPLMTLYTANETWSFGYPLCQFWLCIDYLMSNASVLNLLLISFDRYFSVTRPLSYRPKRTTRKALFMIAGAYLISLVLWPPWIILWPYMEGRFIVEEDALCVVQFLALGDARNWRNQLATVVTAAAAFYIPVTLMIVLYYKVYLETQRRQKELRKLQDGQQLFSPSKLAGTSALHSLLLPLTPLIRGLQASSAADQPPSSMMPPSNSLPVSVRTISTAQAPPTPVKQTATSNSRNSRLNFMEQLVGNISSIQQNGGPTSFKKKERFSLLRYCTGKAQADVSSEGDSAEDPSAVVEETCGLTTSNLDSILMAENMANNVELAHSADVVAMAREEESTRARANTDGFAKEGSAALSSCNALELGRTSRPSSVHTYNSIVIIEYPESGGRESQRPSVRLSSQAEVESLSARNSVERRLEQPQLDEQRRKASSITAATTEKTKKQPAEPVVEEMVTTKAKDCKDKGGKLLESQGSERQKLRLTKSCPGGPGAQLTAGRAPNQQQQQQNGLMKKSEIQLLREEQMRRSEKERRRNERKQESKAAKTLSAILFAFIITWTPYNVIVCLEAFYPNSVPASLFTLSYFFCYFNSTVNPLCYALCNARFRMTYMRIIRCKWGRRNSGGGGHFYDRCGVGFGGHGHHHHQRAASAKRGLLLKGGGGHNRHRRTSTTNTTAATQPQQQQ